MEYTMHEMNVILFSKEDAVFGTEIGSTEAIGYDFTGTGSDDTDDSYYNSISVASDS